MEEEIDYSEKTRKVKDLLSSYYGIADDDDNPHQADPDSHPTYENEYEQRPQLVGISQNEAGEIQVTNSLPSQSSFNTLDSATFNANQFVNSLLKRNSLEELLGKHIEMAREITRLSSDMQALVYENYNKFISATDTIKDMKSKVEQLNPQLEELRETIDQVAERSHDVNSRLQERRDSVEQLNRVENLLKKLQVVFQLPQRLKVQIREGAFDIAVDEYVRVRGLLKRYGHAGAFRQLNVEVHNLMEEVKKKLRLQLRDEDGQAEIAARKLMQLGESQDELEEQFLEGRKICLQQILDEAAIVVNRMAQGHGLPSASTELFPDNLMTTERYRSTLRDWGFSKDLKTSPELSSFIKTLNERFINSIANVISLHSSLFTDASTDAHADVQKRLHSAARDLFRQYFQILRKVLAQTSAIKACTAAGVYRVFQDELVPPLSLDGSSAGFLSDWGAELLSRGLEHIKADINRVDHKLPEYPLVDRGAELVEGAIRHHIGVSICALERRILNAVMYLQHLLEKNEEEKKNEQTLLLTAYASLCELLRKGVSALLFGLKMYETYDRLLSTWKDLFVDLILGQLQNFFLSLLHSFLEIVGAKGEVSGDMVNYSNPPPLGLGFVYEGGLAEQEGDLNPLLPTDSQWREPGSKEQEQRIRRGLSSDLVDLAIPITSLTSFSCPPGLVLLLARYCSFIETEALPQVMETVAISFPGQGQGGGEDAPPPFVVGHVARQLHIASDALLRKYIMTHGKRLGLLFRQTLAASDWLNMKEPRGPRPVCDAFLNMLNTAEQEVVQLVDDGGQRATTTEQHPVTILEGRTSLERNVARMFREKIKIFNNVEMTQSSILASMSSLGLKSLVECIRLQTMGRQGLQQLQVDVYYLRPALRRFMSGSEIVSIDGLLDEIMSSALDRSLDPELLDKSVIEHIMNQDESS
eukprot:TRINITY_DN4071_c0_g1_i1.p1 TRINITY_DN4071_c0_g1~~TRINITY_DN4071_c0_g1_i1.p1  ORF type:complete len:949 (-),score=156.60 TRINITY_DN4071_c0_g1_i1:429-3209(-)